MNDILLDNNNDLLINNDDFDNGNSNYQEIQLILMSEKGMWKQFSYIGAAINKSFNGFIDTKTIQNIRTNLETDNFSVKSIRYNNSQIEILASK